MRGASWTQLDPAPHPPCHPPTRSRPVRPAAARQYEAAANQARFFGTRAVLRGYLTAAEPVFPGCSINAPVRGGQESEKKGY